MAKILYAEDDKDLSAMIKQWLQLECHDVDEVDSGLEALERLEFNNYDLLLLDWNLEDFDGLEICQTFRATNKATPIILLTGNKATDLQESGLRAGANRVFRKPPDLDVLIASINELSKGP